LKQRCGTQRDSDFYGSVLDNLAPTGAVGAQRRVRIRSAWRRILAPGIKILLPGTGTGGLLRF